MASLGQHVTWDAVPGADSYKVNLNELAGTTIQQVVVDAADPLEVLLDDLYIDPTDQSLNVTIGAGYKIAIKATNELGDSPPTEISITVAGPSAPLNVVIV